MQFSTVYSKTRYDALTTKSARGSIAIHSNGWSGKVVNRASAESSDREFIFTVTGGTSLTDRGESGTYTAHSGYVDQSQNGEIIGISLEHFGVINEDITLNGNVQTLGKSSDGSNTVPAWGAAPGATQLSVDFGYIKVHSMHYETTESGGTSGDLTDIVISDIGCFYNYGALNIPVSVSGNWAADMDTVIETDLPIFENDEDLLEYINSGGTVINKMLNRVNPEEDYELNDTCWYIHNVYGHNTKNRANYDHAMNYKFYPQTGRICLYRHTPTASDPSSLKLLSYTGYTTYKAGAYDENFVPYSGSIESNYINKSLQFASNDYYTVFVQAEPNTNIPIFSNISQATDYITYRVDITAAENYADLAIEENEIIEPDFGVEDTSTPIGSNDQAYNIAGFHLYEVSHTELSSFFLEIFDPSPGAVDAILDGTKLFSGNEINAIMMCMFLPIDDISKICTMGSTSKISVGTWTADHSEGTRIASNDVIMNMGECAIPYRYNSEEDFEPYTNFYIQLPYCGTQQLQVSKYIGKTLRCDYAVSVADGSCKALLYADNILMDEFSGCMGCMRPITASDAAQYVSNIVNGIMGSGSQIAGGAAGALKSGLEAGASGNALGAAGAALSAGSVAGSGVWKGYELLQAAETPPMSVSGSLSGGICYFGVQKPHLIIAQKATVRPGNERLTIGYPSGRGGKIGSFSGYLKCSAVKIPNFRGTKEEYNDLIQILSQGIYLS